MYVSVYSARTISNYFSWTVIKERNVSKMLTTANRGLTHYSLYFCYSSPAVFFSSHQSSSQVSSEDLIQSVPLKYYATLNVTPESSAQEVKGSYIELARKYHPDSDNQNANAEKFAEINYAYNIIMKKFQLHPQTPVHEENIKEKQFNNNPQHRHYLSYEGFGIGTMSQREKQYGQYRVMRAAEKRLQYQIEKFTYPQEDAMIVKDKKSTKKFKTSNAIERVVEDLIQDAMMKGEFHNLPGSGKPLSYSTYNPMIDITTQNLNKVLINNGYTPEWILMRKNIIEKLQNIRSNLAKCLSKSEGLDDSKILNQFQMEVKTINKKIDQYNMVVPVLYKQMVHYDPQKEFEKIKKNPQAFLSVTPTSDRLSCQSNMNNALNNKTIDWSQVWRDIKDSFK